MFLGKASQLVVTSAVKISRITKLGKLVTGFIFLSVATSLPEFAVTFSAIVSQNIGISVGDLLGSNIANLGLVLGFIAFLKSLKVGEKTYEEIVAMLFLTALILLLLLWAREATRFVGFILVICFFLFSFYLAKRKITLEIPKIKLKSLYEFYKSLLFLFLGAVLIVISAQFTVSSASYIAKFLGVTQSFVGATLIALGTSLPEFFTSLAAVEKKQLRLGLGNLIGSCVTNITLILGALLFYSPFKVHMMTFSSLLFFTLTITLLTWYLLTTGKRLNKMEGVVLLATYLLFILVTGAVQII
jgi:cation:H+ antiporter